MELVFIIIVPGFSSIMFSYCYHSIKILMKATEGDEEKQKKQRKPSCILLRDARASAELL